MRIAITVVKIKGILMMSKQTEATEGESKRTNRQMKCRSRISKIESSSSLDYAAGADGDQPLQGTTSSREEKVSSLKTGLVLVARKMPKNTHAHFLLGLMYQRLVQSQKVAFEQPNSLAEEILLRCEQEIARPKLLSLVQIHHAQYLILENLGENSLDKELEAEDLEEILSKLKESMQADIRQAVVGRTSDADEFSKDILGDVVTYSTLLHVYIEKDNVKGIMGTRERLEESGIIMDVVMCNILIKA
ncbi:hypothetical protein Ddye_015520 [Dipteronia dyeriana]|uniref:Uncharacterized protein n=1 Tax=Dipteronia dyeriana TaxID=168575 RepID=A0AAD9WYK4_9ROSI|nr:hypothetical protein Ddye_015520 [Dipteronia dyeriana]